MSIKQSLDDKGRTVFNAVLNSRFDLTKMLVYIRARIPLGWDDPDFKREFLRTMIDVEKLLSGRKTSLIVKIVAKFILSACDRKIQFPLVKVRPTN
jgi:hypothetical protein